MNPKFCRVTVGDGQLLHDELLRNKVRVDSRSKEEQVLGSEGWSVSSRRWHANQSVPTKWWKIINAEANPCSSRASTVLLNVGNSAAILSVVSSIRSQQHMWKLL